MAIYGGRLMYQFMVGHTTPGVTRMAMTSGTNKWASRVVVILQLAAWSAVGIVLLQKGVTSLQKKTLETSNVTQITSLNTINVQPPTEKDLSVIPIVEENLHNRESFNIKDKHLEDLQHESKALDMSPEDSSSLIDPEDEPRVLESVESPLKIDNEVMKKLLKTVKKRTKWDELKNSSNLSKDFSKNSFNTEKETERLSDKTDNMFNTKMNMTDKIFVKSNDESTTSTLSSSPTRPGGVWESRRRLRLSHLSGGGAAAAVAMVAVGAVMLVLGPAVIVLRALDERRQERRFLKLSGRDDLPPTYEQATLMDEAPRYSSLSLNTILGPPPPPSPTPVRVHLV